MKFFKAAAAFVCLLFISALAFGCCAEPTPPDELIVGSWEYRNQAWCEFHDDNTCIIGGVAGTYEIKDDNSITLSVYTSDYPQVFEWAGSSDNADFDSWFVDGSTLYINGMVYPKIDEAASAAESSTESTAESAASGSSSE